MIPLIVILMTLHSATWFVHSELSDFIGVQREAHAAGISNDEIQKPPSSRSGQSENADLISPAEMWVRLQEEGQPWREPPILKGNSAADRLNHNPE